MTHRLSSSTRSVEVTARRHFSVCAGNCLNKVTSAMVFLMKNQETPGLTSGGLWLVPCCIGAHLCHRRSLCYRSWKLLLTKHFRNGSLRHLCWTPGTSCVSGNYGSDSNTCLFSIWCAWLQEDFTHTGCTRQVEVETLRQSNLAKEQKQTWSSKFSNGSFFVQLVGVWWSLWGPKFGIRFEASFFSADDGKCLSLQRFLKRLLYCNKLICWFRDWQSPKIFVFNFPVRSLASSLATICWQRQLPCHYWVYQVALNLNWTAELGLSSVKIHLNFDLCLKRRLAVLRQSLDVDFKLNRMRVGIMISNCQQIWPL